MTDHKKNETSEFVFQGFSEDPKLQIPLFCIFLMIYLLTLLGNLIILTVIYLNPVLHIPMYLFLCNLSCIDIFVSSVSQPKLLSMLLLGDNSISFSGCIIQLHCFAFSTCVEFVSLTAMAYDRYVAICNPLRYSILMNKRVCVLMIIICWVFGFFEPLAHTLLTSQLSFCTSHVINHFVCDVSMLLKLSCVDTFFIEMMTYILCSVVGLPVFTLIIISYVYIITSILKIRSAKGRNKAFSTCTSHLIVVIFFYGAIFLTYFRLSSHYSASESKPLSVIYTAIIPMVNPFIYTLRNKDIRKSLCVKKPKTQLKC